MTLTFMGTGTSHGVPVVGCSCKICTSDDERDRRYRSSAVVHGDHGETIVIDTGPEFRLQALRAGLSSLDAVLVTHAHADHIHGLDDVRPLTRGHDLPVMALPSDIREIRERFSYAFRETQAGGGKPRLKLSPVRSHSFVVGSILITPVPLLHGERTVLGFRLERHMAGTERIADSGAIDTAAGTGMPGLAGGPVPQDVRAGAGGLAYLTDCSVVPRRSMRLLHGLDILVIDALRLRPHPTHLSIGQALDVARQLAPRRVLLTHLCHDHTHADLEAICAGFDLPFPAGPAWDGLSLKF